MTFSIAARCGRTGQIGVAAATAMPAVGKLLTHAFTGVGALLGVSMLALLPAFSGSLAGAAAAGPLFQGLARPMSATTSAASAHSSAVGTRARRRWPSPPGPKARPGVTTTPSSRSLFATTRSSSTPTHR